MDKIQSNRQDTLRMYEENCLDMEKLNKENTELRTRISQLTKSIEENTWKESRQMNSDNTKVFSLEAV